MCEGLTIGEDQEALMRKHVEQAYSCKVSDGQWRELLKLYRNSTFREFVVAVTRADRSKP